jgi:hypothetical protein
LKRSIDQPIVAQPDFLEAVSWAKTLAQLKIDLGRVPSGMLKDSLVKLVDDELNREFIFKPSDPSLSQPVTTICPMCRKTIFTTSDRIFWHMEG